MSAPDRIVVWYGTAGAEWRVKEPGEIPAIFDQPRDIKVPQDYVRADLFAALEAKLAEVDERIENAKQSMAETQPSWEHRCHAIMAALGVDFGGPTPDLPEQDSWYARNLKRAEDEAFRSLQLRLAEMERKLGDAKQALSNEQVAHGETLRGRNVVRAEAAESRVKALEADLRDEQGHVKRLQKALAFWMPGVSPEIEEELNGRAGDDACLLAGYDGEHEEECWGDTMVSRVKALEEALQRAALAPVEAK